MDMAGIRVAVIGGDRRMAHAARALADRGLWVRTAHLPRTGDGPATDCGGVREALAGAQAVLLPVQAVGEDGRIHTGETGTPVCLRETDWDLVMPGAVVFAGKVSPAVAATVRSRGLELVEYRDRDDFALYNSVPSAEGALAMAMAASPLCLFDSASLVIGYGRCGTTLAGMLRGIGARTTVAAGPETERARAWAAGHGTLPLTRLAEAVAASDFIFNTVPALVLPRPLLMLIPRHTAIIDLASAPGGCDVTAAGQLGLTVHLAPGLPGKVAPVTAGRIVADLVIRHLTEQPPVCLGGGGEAS